MRVLFWRWWQWCFWIRPMLMVLMMSLSQSLIWCTTIYNIVIYYINHVCLLSFHVICYAMFTCLFICRVGRSSISNCIIVLCIAYHFICVVSGAARGTRVFTLIESINALLSVRKYWTCYIYIYLYHKNILYFVYTCIQNILYLYLYIERNGTCCLIQIIWPNQTMLFYTIW